MNNYLKLFIFSAVVVGAYFALMASDFGQYIHSTAIAAIIFYSLQSLLLLWAEGNFVNNDGQNFVLFVIGSISFRLLTSLLVAITYLVAIGEENTSFIMTFFALYLLFLGFELFTHMTNLRSNSKSVQIDG
ncbi:MAG: hypothetical protein RIG68_05375 [Imperialibacter sp.]|uniref:hypothetical protein n=1 Tax=Imperialibacter sp. TaxID=2038411 RepID=UPI0032EBAFE5